MHMNEIASRMRAQLTVIEQIYDIKIQNKDEIIRLAVENINDPRRVLALCTSLNTWAANNCIKGDIVMPLEVVISAIENL